MQNNSKNRMITYADAVREAFDLALQKDSSVIIIGEGVPDPKNIFGTTRGLQEKYGESRVFDMPLSENGVTGICIGAALNGLKPVLIHQRIDFALLSLDQIINNAAKWHYMFNGVMSVPLVVRMIIGRGWGQGPQHSQSLQAIFSHIPGLKVVMPSTAKDAKGMMLNAIQDKNPVIFIEHRWLHNVSDNVPDGYYEIEINKAKVIKPGVDVTVIGMSLSTMESLEVANRIENEYKISCEIIDLRSIRPIDYITVLQSVRKTGRLLVVDTGYKEFGVGSEIISRCVMECFSFLKCAPRILGLPEYPCPTAEALSANYYPTEIEIAESIFQLVGKSDIPEKFYKNLKRETPHDVPYTNFSGPF